MGHGSVTHVISSSAFFLLSDYLTCYFVNKVDNVSFARVATLFFAYVIRSLAVMRFSVT